MPKTKTLYHINPIIGAVVCRPTSKACMNEQHFSNKIKALGNYKNSVDSSYLFNFETSNRSTLNSTLEALSFEELLDYANSSVTAYNSLLDVIDYRLKYTKLALSRFESVNPNLTESVFNKTSYKRWLRDLTVYRDNTAEFLEAKQKSIYYVSPVSVIPDGVPIGVLEKTTEYDANTLEWQQERYNTMGGSDVGALAVKHFSDEELTGLDKLSYAKTIKSKTTYPTEVNSGYLFDPKNIVRNGPLYRGTIWEEEILANYAIDNPEVKVYLSKDQYVNPTAKWQKVNFDGILCSNDNGIVDGIIEIKTTTEPEVWENGIPLNYRAQTLYYLYVSKLKKAVVQVLINDIETRTYTLNHNDDVSPGSGVKMSEFVENIVTPWFENVKKMRVEHSE